jgi:hypothetical protein
MACRRGAVDVQHGTGVDGSLHLSIKGYYPSTSLFLHFT